MLSLLTFLIFFSGAAETATKPTPEQETLLKTVDEKYQSVDSVVMNAKKTTKSGVFDQTEEAAGKLYVQKGKLRLDVQNKEKDKSLVIADGSHLWLVTPPPKEFKNAKTQVLKASLSTSQARSQGLLQILTEGGILKYFKITSVSKDGALEVFNLQPNKEAQELKRVRLALDPQEKTIVSLKYWDNMDNETAYDFSSVKFNQKVDKKLFQYVPPKNADVVTP